MYAPYSVYKYLDTRSDFGNRQFSGRTFEELTFRRRYFCSYGSIIVYRIPMGDSNRKPVLLNCPATRRARQERTGKQIRRTDSV